MKVKNYIIISVDAAKLFDKIKYLLEKETLNKLVIGGDKLNVIKTTCEKLAPTIILYEERLKTFPLR